MPSIESVPAVGAEPVALPAARAQPPAPEPARPESVSATRLLIEDVGGRYVYTLLDRVSGQVIVQLPRQDLARLAEIDRYDAGAVVSTRA